MNQIDRPNRVASHRDSSRNSTKDWSSSPAAIFATCVLALASLGGLFLSWDRTIQHDIASDSARPNQTDQGFEQSSDVLDQSKTSRQSSNEPVSSGIIKLIDINNASAAQLDMLPGVGPAIASRIIADRDEHGPFQSIDDLQRVSGIGPKTVEKLRHLVTIGELNLNDDSTMPTSIDEDG